jgi:uncharacterized membrane protein
MEAFSDGVFAIAITLLVLEIGIPSGSEDDLLAAVLAQWPSYLAYLVSFSTIGAVWLEHTVITEFLDHATAVFIRLNLLLLLVVSLLPFRRGCLVSTSVRMSRSGLRSRFMASTCSWRRFLSLCCGVSRCGSG